MSLSTLRSDKNLGLHKKISFSDERKKSLSQSIHETKEMVMQKFRFLLPQSLSRDVYARWVDRFFIPGGQPKRLVAARGLVSVRSFSYGIGRRCLKGP